MSLDTRTPNNLEPWLKAVKEKVEATPSSSDLNLQEGWERLAQEIPVRPRFIFSKPFLRKVGSIAAVFFLALGVGITIWKHQNEATPLEGQKEPMMIADNSHTSIPSTPHRELSNPTIIKNSNSSISASKSPVQELTSQTIESITEEEKEFTEPKFNRHSPSVSIKTTEEESKSTEEYSLKNEKTGREIGVTPPPPSSVGNNSPKDNFPSARDILAYDNDLSIQAYANTTPSSQKGKNYVPNQPQLRASQARRLASAQSSEYNYDRATFHHAQPFNIGFRFSYALNSVLALESGISYTYLRSNVLNLGAIPQVRQHIHYLGVPIGVQLKLAEVNNFRFYTAANVQIDKMLLAKIEKEKLDTKAWQFSLQGRAGISYQITRHFSLFAEGGLGYYFDDNSRLHTFYKEHPLRFSLNSGIRINY